MATLSDDLLVDELAVDEPDLVKKRLRKNKSRQRCEMDGFDYLKIDRDNRRQIKQFISK